MVWSREDKWEFTSVNSFSHHCSCCSGNHLQGDFEKTLLLIHLIHWASLFHAFPACLIASPGLYWEMIKTHFLPGKKALLLRILYFLAVKDACFVQTWNFCSGCTGVHIQAALLGDKNRYANTYWRFISKKKYTNSSLQEVWKSAFVQHKNPVCCTLPETTEICLLMRFNHPGSNLSHLPFSTISHQNT